MNSNEATGESLCAIWGGEAMRPMELRSVESFARTLRDNNLGSGNTLIVSDSIFEPGCPAVKLADLDDTLLDKLRPTFIVTPLVSHTFDAMDVAEALYCAGYTGELVVMANALPSPAVVERELRDTAPGLCVTLSVPNRSTLAH